VITVVTSLMLVGCDRESTPHGHPSVPAARDSAEGASTRSVTKSGYADVNGGHHYYEVRGDLTSGKTPLVVLHGSLMSADAMAPLVERFARSRPVIALDARGHGRTRDIPGPITYELLADDVAGVLAALGVARADVLGYSMGGTTAIVLAVRHPERVNKVVSLSGPYSPEGWYPEVRKGFDQWSPTMLAGTGLEAEYKRLSPTPDGLLTLIPKLKAMETAPWGIPEERVRALGARTMLVVGDADGLQLDYALKLFALRGGGDRDAAVKGFLADAPRARLAVLPATSHVGMMARPQLIVDVVTPFLDDEKPPMPDNFLKPGPGEAATSGSGP
jgi:pimeloyl-ACP methyl ester carboxylesterase